MLTGEQGMVFQGSGFMKKLVLSGVAIAAMLALSGAASAQGTIKIGVAGPLTGPNAAFGAQLKNGAEMMAANLNAKGGMNGMKIELVFGDDVSDPKQGVSVANKMVGDGVKFVVGHFNSGVTMPASEVYAENGVLVITPSATNPKITERGLWNVFRTCGRDDQQGDVAGKYLATTLKGKKVAIVHDKTTYGKGLADETQKAANANGVKEVLYEGVNTGEKDFSALVSKIKASGAEIVYWGGLHTEGGLIARQMRDQGVTATMMSGDGITSDEFASIGGPAVEGTKMTFPADPRKRPEAAAVVKQFEEKKFNPEAYTLYSYAALEIVAAAATEAKSVDPKKVAEVMKGGKTWPTVIGGIQFDKKGDITRPDYVMYTWKKGADGKTTYIQD
jgi:branched-chain amino acid transport system substrate-binding protein